MNETLLSRTGNIQELYFFIIFFFKETGEEHKGRLLAAVTFFYFLHHVSSLAESAPRMITTSIEQHIYIYSTFVCLSLMKGYSFQNVQLSAE